MYLRYIPSLLGIGSVANAWLTLTKRDINVVSVMHAYVMIVANVGTVWINPR